MPLVKVTSKRQITIPSALSKELGIKSGDHVEVAREGDRLVVKPVLVIDKSEAWFYSKQWQAKERQVDKSIAKGETEGPFDNAKEAIAHLRKKKS